MHRSLIFVPLLALAACGQSETTPAADTTTIAVPTPATTGAATGDMSGTYEVTMADGTVMMETVNTDGTYVDTQDGEEVDRGRWRADGNRMCYDPDGADPEACYSSTAPAADGSFRVIGADGQQTGATVRKIGTAPAQ